MRHAARGGDDQPLGRRRPRRLHARPSTRPRPRPRRRGRAAPTTRRSATSPCARRSSTSLIEGAIYLAQPDDPRRRRRGGEPLRHPARGLPGRQGARARDPGQARRQARPRPGDGQPHRDLRRPAPAPLHRPRTSTSATASAPRWSPRPPAAPLPPQIDLTPWAGPARRPLRPPPPQIATGIGGGPCPTGHAALRPGRRGRRRQLQRRLLHPLLRPPDPHRHRAGDHLLLAGPAARGCTGKLAGIPFCPDAAIEAATSQTRRGGGGAPLLPGGEPGRPHPDRLRGRLGPHLRARASSTSPAPTTARRSRWWRSTRPRSAPSTSARS